MRIPSKIFSLAAATVVFGAVSASAATIDFTDDSVATALAGTEKGGWVVTGSPEDPDGLPFDTHPNCAITGLTCENDGLGIKDDEFSNDQNGVQFATITFNEKVKIIAVHFLDVYTNASGSTKEQGLVTIGGTAPGVVAASVTATGTKSNSNPGFESATGLELIGTTFSFWAGRTNDAAGSADVALAAIEVASVPVPAGLLLMGTALGGLGLARRRKMAS